MSLYKSFDSPDDSFRSSGFGIGGGRGGGGGGHGADRMSLASELVSALEDEVGNGASAGMSLAEEFGIFEEAKEGEWARQRL